MKSMIKDALILFIITVIAGAALGAVYMITKEPIAKAEYSAAQEAYKEVFVNAASFEEVASAADVSTGSASKNWSEAGFENVSVEAVLAAKDSEGTECGYVLTMITKEGYGGDIKFTMGISNDGTLNGISILSISETAGLGMRAEEVLKPQYAGKKVSSFNLTKTGAIGANDIDAISGATITSKAVTNAVNAGLFYFDTYLGGGNNEN